MAMTSGGKGQINVTPMIDVLLVLLIIFMVVVNSDAYGLDAQVPQEAKNEAPANNQDLVLFVDAERNITLNQEPVDETELYDRLAAVFKTRGNHVLFVGGAAELDFKDIVHVIDVARGAGLTRVALMPSKP